MPSSILQVKRSAAGTTRVVHATGELDMATVKRVKEAVDGALSECAETVVLDLSELSFCDSSGVRLAVSAHRRAEAHGIRFVVVHPSGTARRVFEICDTEAELTVTAASAA